LKKHVVRCAGIRRVPLFGPGIIIARKSKKNVSVLQEIGLNDRATGIAPGARVLDFSLGL
jgi:hypothetical protein